MAVAKKEGKTMNSSRGVAVQLVGVLEERVWSLQMEADRKSTRNGQSGGKKGMTMNEGSLKEPRVAHRDGGYN